MQKCHSPHESDITLPSCLSFHFNYVLFLFLFPLLCCVNNHNLIAMTQWEYRWVYFSDKMLEYCQKLAMKVTYLVIIYFISTVFIFRGRHLFFHTHRYFSFYCQSLRYVTRYLIFISSYIVLYLFTFLSSIISRL